MDRVSGMKRKRLSFRAAVIAALCLPLAGIGFLPDMGQYGMTTVHAAAGENAGIEAQTPPLPGPTAIPILFFNVTQVACHIQATESVLVWTEPFEDTAQCVAQVDAGTVFMVCGVTSNGWFQVRYLGQKCYVSPVNVAFYTGGEERTELPLLDKEKGYRVAFLGDGITYGDKLSSQSDTYASLLTVKMGAESYDNYGVNGSCMGGNHPERFWDRYFAMTEEADLVFVFGGTNDYELGTPLGAMGENSTQSFYGVLNLLMSSMKQKYPDAQIIFMTPLPRLGDTQKNSEGYVLADYANAIVEMGEFYDIPVVDLYHTASMNFVGNDEYSADGLHPTAAGHKALSDYLYGLLWEQQ